MEEREPRVVIKEGESASITCKARGQPPPTYSWIKASTREVKFSILLLYQYILCTQRRYVTTFNLVFIMYVYFFNRLILF